MSVNTKNWQELKKPNTLEIKEGADKKRKATFIAEPLERGYGLTLGIGAYFGNVLIDMAYQLRWGKDIEMNNLIANSEADVTQHTVLVSLIYHF